MTSQAIQVIMDDIEKINNAKAIAEADYRKYRHKTNAANEYQDAAGSSFDEAIEVVESIIARIEREESETKNTVTRARAPKGGITIAGVFYRGGQFLPSDNEPKRGKYNSYAKKSNGHKVQVAPYKWEVAPDGMTATWSKCFTGALTTIKDNKLVWCASPQTEAYYKVTDSFKAEIMAYANKWNNGEYWVAA